MGEDRLAVLSAARVWALSDEALVAGVDALQALVVEAQAALVRFVREVDARRTAAGRGEGRPTVVVTTRFDVLEQVLTGGTMDNGDRVTPATVRRLACQAGIVPCVLDTQGVPLELGRTHRLVSAHLRTALTERDRGCSFPGCDRPARWAEAHQVIHWSVGGPTCLDNLALLCAFHHGEVHKPDGWTVFIAPDGYPPSSHPSTSIRCNDPTEQVPPAA